MMIRVKIIFISIKLHGEGGGIWVSPISLELLLSVRAKKNKQKNEARILEKSQKSSLENPKEKISNCQESKL